VADSKRGERSSEPEFDENLDEFDDTDADSDLDESVETKSAARDRRPAGRTAAKGTKTKKRSGSDLTIFGRLIKFFREVYSELTKVIYPTRKELLTYTSVVLMFVVVLMTVVALLDLGFAYLVGLVFGNKSS
jgi:preprotein translocase subunit SecE